MKGKQEEMDRDDGWGGVQVIMIVIYVTRTCPHSVWGRSLI